jgi:hypothetical protein
MPDLMGRLSQADPARGQSLPATTGAAILARALSSPPVRPGRPARRRLPSRPTLVLAAVLALAICGAGVATFDFGQSANQVEDDYARAIRDVPLPPGYRWPGAAVEEDSVYAGKRAAIMQATAQAGCAWWDYWLSAATRGDAAAMALALAGQQSVFAVTPRAPRGGSEDVGGIDATTVAYHRRLVADARAGRRQRIASYVEVNCSAAIRRR